MLDTLLAGAGTLFTVVTNKSVQDGAARAFRSIFPPEFKHTAEQLEKNNLPLSEMVLEDFCKVVNEFNPSKETNPKLFNRDLKIFLAKLDPKTINNKFYLTTASNNLILHSIASFIIAKTLEFVKSDVPVDQKDRFIQEMNLILRDLEKLAPLELTDYDLKVLADIKSERTNNGTTLEVRNYKKIESFEVPTNSRDMNFDRANELIKRLKKRDVNSNEMPSILSRSNFAPKVAKATLGGVKLDDYLMSLDLNSVRNYIAVNIPDLKVNMQGTILHLLLLYCKEVVNIGTNKSSNVTRLQAQNTFDIINPCIRILIDQKGLTPSNDDLELAKQINTELAKHHFAPELKINLEKTAQQGKFEVEKPVVVKDDEGNQDQSGQSVQGLIAGYKYADSSDVQRALAATSAATPTPTVAANASAAPVAVTLPVDPNLAAKVELTLPQLRAMAAADTPAQPQPQASATTHAAAVTAQPNGGKGGVKQQQRN